MRVDLPRTGTEFLRHVAAEAVRRSSGRGGLWLPGLALVALAYAPVVVLAPGAGPWGNLPWLLAPYVAAVAWIGAARSADQRVRLTCWTFAAGAILGVVTQVTWSFEIHVLGTRQLPVAAYLFLAFFLVLAAGSWLALGTRRGASSGQFADALLVLLAGTVAVLRLVVEPLSAAAVPPGANLGLMASLQTLALIPLLLSALLVLRRASGLSPASAVALLAAALAFAAAGMLSIAGLDPQPFSLGDPVDYLWFVGWLFLGFAGFAARDIPATARGMIRGRSSHDGVRRRIVPAAALFLALVVVDVALRPVTRPETVVAIALLGITLALRSAHAFSLTDREEDRKRQLAFTRALLEVTHSLAEATDLDTTLAVICESSRSVLGTRAAGIEMITDDGATLETRAAVGLPEGILELRFPVRGSFTGWVVQHGEPRAAVDPRNDPYIQPQSLHFLGRSPLAAAPIRFRGQTTGALYACIRAEPFDPEELAFLGAMAEQAAIAIERARLFDQVSILSVTDPLTGLANRRSLEREMQREFAAARRGRELVAVVFDLDDFKLYNDSFGHLAGDQVLQGFAAAIREETRAMNLAARYGGDEFVALLSDTSVQGARAFIDRVRDRFRAAVLALGRGPVELSAGLAAYDPVMTGPDDLLRLADEDMYRQKPRVRV